MSTNESSYSETQRFRQWWLWLTVLTGPAISIWAVFQQIVMGYPIRQQSRPGLRAGPDRRWPSSIHVQSATRHGSEEFRAIHTLSAVPPELGSV